MDYNVFKREKQIVVQDWKAENGQAIKYEKNKGNLQFLRQGGDTV
jgi:hypothetical protein